MMSAITLTPQERERLRQKLGLDARSGTLLDTRRIGDIADHHIQQEECGNYTMPHDLLPRWFKYTLLVVGSLWGLLFYFIQPAPFWWLR